MGAFAAVGPAVATTAGVAAAAVVSGATGPGARSELIVFTPAAAGSAPVASTSLASASATAMAPPVRPLCEHPGYGFFTGPGKRFAQSTAVQILKAHIAAGGSGEDMDRFWRFCLYIEPPEDCLPVSPRIQSFSADPNPRLRRGFAC